MDGDALTEMRACEEQVLGGGAREKGRSKQFGFEQEPEPSAKHQSRDVLPPVGKIQVQQRGDDSEGHRDGLIGGEGGEGPGVDVDAGHEVQGDHRDVGGAGGDGFPPALPRVGPY